MLELAKLYAMNTIYNTILILVLASSLTAQVKEHDGKIESGEPETGDSETHFKKRLLTSPERIEQRKREIEAERKRRERIRRFNRGRRNNYF